MARHAEATNDFAIYFIGFLKLSVTAENDRHPGVGVVDRIAVGIGAYKFVERSPSGVQIRFDYSLREKLLGKNIVQ